jgi:hypothetical protein
MGPLGSGCIRSQAGDPMVEPWWLCKDRDHTDIRTVAML